LPILQSHDRRLNIGVCVGTNCYVKGSQQILQKLLQHVEEHDLSSLVDIRAMFCTENCEHGPTVLIGEERICKCTADQAIAAVEEQLQPATAD
jgi:NADH:ubiquinone oxidoreductase subunit E